ncbi:flavin reductase family protein [Aeromicrobium massiliense]|uniref:flavin reductase family protein n=1 Tax=Aeromicrobium massiliense TaxID=1464554 RepID=UPI00030E2CC8|nr:flavin reductase family protein [Aeromicrobium massiliense]
MPDPVTLGGGAASTVTPRRMRDALAGYPTGLVLVAGTDDGATVGMLASSFTSVSLEPPLVSLAFARTSTTWPRLQRADRWGLSVLSQQQADLLPLLARPADVRFDDVGTSERHGGLVLPDAALTLTVTRHAEVEAGDHVLALLRVLDVHRDDARPPVVVHDRRARHLAA